MPGGDGGGRSLSLQHGSCAAREALLSMGREGGRGVGVPAVESICVTGPSSLRSEERKEGLGGRERSFAQMLKKNKGARGSRGKARGKRG